MRGALGVGRDQPQLGAARERLAEPHPGMDAERLGRARDLAHDLLAVRLRRERDRLPQQLAPCPHRRQQLEAGDQDADDHDERMFAYLPATGQATCSEFHLDCTSPMIVRVSTDLDIPADLAWETVKKPETFRYVVRGVHGCAAARRDPRGLG